MNKTIKNNPIVIWRMNIKSFFKAGFAILLLSGLQKTSPCFAIATADLARSETPPETALGTAFSWNFVYKYKNSSAVAVDHYWILTAAHVADDTRNSNIIIDGDIYMQQKIIFHDTADLALVRFDKPFPGYYPLHDGKLYRTEESKGERVRIYDPLIMVGYGRTGIVTQTTFGNGPGGAGKKRWGTNRGSSVETEYSINVGGSAGLVKTCCFYMGFDINDTPYEAGAVQHDSGGPVFINQGAGWKIAGIILYLHVNRALYTGNWLANITHYTEWITNSIPDYDTDMDGLPDQWEKKFGSGNTSINAGEDSDGDGFTNHEEWLADTIPTNSASFFKVIEYTDAARLVFSSSTNRKYQVQYRGNLIDGTWNTAVGWFTGSLSQTAQTVSTEASNSFYRVRVKVR